MLFLLNNSLEIILDNWKRYVKLQPVKVDLLKSIAWPFFKWRGVEKLKFYDGIWCKTSSTTWENFSKPRHDFSVISYDFFYFCKFFASSVNAPYIFQSPKSKTSGTRNYLQNGANRNSLRLLVLSNNVINFRDNIQIYTQTSQFSFVRLCLHLK